MARYAAGAGTDLDVLCIGGGGYSFSRYPEVDNPQASVEFVEIDPEVTRIAHDALGLPRATRIVTHNEDARTFLRDLEADGRYDRVTGDAFNYMSVPCYLTTLEFNEAVRRAMRPNGFYVANVIDDLKGGRFARSFMQTRARTFRRVHVVQPGGGCGLSTYAVVATNRELNRADLVRLIGTSGEKYATGVLMTLAEAERAAGPGEVLVLTDDYVPVDDMIALLFKRGLASRPRTPSAPEGPSSLARADLSSPDIIT